MYRTNAQSRALEEAFIRYGTPYKLVAGTRFYERREVKDIIAYLRLIQNPHDSVSLLRIINVPGRGIGQQSQSQLSSWAKSLGSLSMRHYSLSLNQRRRRSISLRLALVSAKALAGFLSLMEEFIARSRELNLVDLFDLVIKRTGYKEYILSGEDGEERWENILELRTVAQEYRRFETRGGLGCLS